jgi:NADH:ubiquinone oxidoreductase subunit 2 (subunit N)
MFVIFRIKCLGILALIQVSSNAFMSLFATASLTSAFILGALRRWRYEAKEGAIKLFTVFHLFVAYQNCFYVEH